MDSIDKFQVLSEIYGSLKAHQFICVKVTDMDEAERESQLPLLFETFSARLGEMAAKIKVLMDLQ